MDHAFCPAALALQHEAPALTPELLAPAGGFEAACAAFQYGADAVYLGLPRFSARADAEHLTPDRLRLLKAYAQSFTPAKRVYVTFNTLLTEPEWEPALDLLASLDELAPDGVIVQDLGVARLIRDHFPRLALHASTQLATHNLEGALALRDLGFTRVVLARELTLDEIRRITRESGVETEVFLHGALCYSYSGLCLFSSLATGRSGNRGRCAYCCREPFTAADAAPDEAAPHFPFSMRDLCLAPLLDEVTGTGAHALKIEGRMKSPLYVACVTDYYRRKLDGTLSPGEERERLQDLQTIFSRPGTTLYSRDSRAHPDTVIDPLAVGHRGALIGEAEAVIRDRDGTRWLRFRSNRALEKHDGLQLELAGGGRPLGFAVMRLRPSGTRRPVLSLAAGERVEVALPEGAIPPVPCGTPVFCSASQAVRRRYGIQSVRESGLTTGRPVDFEVRLSPEGIAVLASAACEPPDRVTAETQIALPLSPSRQPEQSLSAVQKAFGRLGDPAWRPGTLTFRDPAGCYAPLSQLNACRRDALARLNEAWARHAAARREAITRIWQPQPTPPPTCPEAAPDAQWTLKCRADAQPLPAAALSGLATLVLRIGHASSDTLTRQLAAWRETAPSLVLCPALPVITRAGDAAGTREALRVLAREGWDRWECADLSGWRMLREEGLTPHSADWSLYALNRAACAECARLGFEAHVLSPEISLDNIRALCRIPAAAGPVPVAEMPVYQHTPLFLSETAPLIGGRLPSAEECARGIRIANRRGHTFTVLSRDRLWVTVADEPYCLADRLPELRAAGLSRFRIDLSWSPETSDAERTVRNVMSGKLPQSHVLRGNLDRGLA